MKRLDDLIQKLKRFEDTLFEAIEQAVKDNAAIIEEYNTEDQLFEQGIDRTGSLIVPGYSPITIQIKRGKGQTTSHVTLRDTGAFHRSFSIQYLSDGFQIVASDWKTTDLMRAYGSEILGLSDDNFRDFAVNYVAPEIIKMFRNL